MIQDSSPITPPRELVYRLQDLGNLDAIELAFQAGADQELEACCEWIESESCLTNSVMAKRLRDARRPKPPSLKERIATAIAHGDNSIALALLDQALPD